MTAKKSGDAPEKKEAARPLFPPELNTIRIARPFGCIGAAEKLNR
jgi:hypothetical protein